MIADRIDRTRLAGVGRSGKRDLRDRCRPATVSELMRAQGVNPWAKDYFIEVLGTDSVVQRFNRLRMAPDPITRYDETDQWANSGNLRLWRHSQRCRNYHPVPTTALQRR
jgi:hypothetical protein